MSVLESFFFVFDADASRLRSGVDSATQSSDGLERSLQAADGTAEKLGSNFNDMAKAASGVLASVISLVAIKKLTLDTTDNTYAVYQQAHAMAMNVETLSQWQQAVVMSGGTAEGLTSTLENLQHKFVEMARYGGISNGDTFMFKELGLSAKQMHDSIKDPTIALRQLAETVGTLGLNRTQLNFLGKIGIDQGTLNLISEGRRKLDELIAEQKEYGFITKAQAADTIKYELATKRLGIAYESLSRDVTSKLLPTMTWLQEKVESMILFFHKNEQVATAFFTGLAVAAGSALLMVAGAGIVAAAPFLLLGAAIALVIDDFQAYRNGQDSLIGEAMTKWPILGQVVRSSAEIIDMAINKDGIIKSYDAMRDSLSDMVDQAKIDFPTLAKVANGAMDGMTWGIKEYLKWAQMVMDFLESIPISIIDGIGHYMARITGGNYDDTHNPVKAAKASDSFKEKSPALIKEIMARYGVTEYQAAGIVGNLGAESGLVPGLQEKNPKSGRGGLGWAQWTGSRRDDFEEYALKHGLRTDSDEANKAFLFHELDNKYRSSIDKVKSTTNAHDAMRAFEADYEKAGVKNFEGRQAFSDVALASYALSNANNSPINSLSSNAFGSAGSSKSISVQTGEIHINTQATDADGISKSIFDKLQEQISHALNHWDDGADG